MPGLGRRVQRHPPRPGSADRDEHRLPRPRRRSPRSILSVMYSLPQWLVERQLMAAYGYDTAAAIAAYRQRDAGIDPASQPDAR